VLNSIDSVPIVRQNNILAGTCGRRKQLTSWHIGIKEWGRRRERQRIRQSQESAPSDLLPPALKFLASPQIALIPWDQAFNM
jgi:hypothetical protein